MELEDVEWIRLAQSGTAVNTVMNLQVQYTSGGGILHQLNIC
jgi:hypothetical protein